MGQLLSLSISIPIILILLMGGLTIMIIPINNEPTIWWNPITLILWFMGLVWLGAVLLYRKQNVDIDVVECILSKSREGYYIFTVKGFIRSRHPDSLRQIELAMRPEFTVPISPSSVLPDSINSVPQKFELTSYDLSSNILDEWTAPL